MNNDYGAIPAVEKWMSGGLGAAFNTPASREYERFAALDRVLAKPLQEAHAFAPGTK
jgi:hypothetical protein